MQRIPSVRPESLSGGDAVQLTDYVSASLPVLSPTQQSRVWYDGHCSSVGKAIAWTLVGLYFLRASIFGNITGIGTAYLGAACYGAVGLAVVYLFSTKFRFSTLIGFFLVVGTGASLSMAENLQGSFARWIGWLLLCFAVGPLIEGNAARGFRKTCFKAMKYFLHGTTLLSAVWWLLPLPSFGRGVFSGIFAHSMLLGPAAALAAVLSLGTAIRTGSKIWAGIFLVESASCLFAGSRAAFAAYMAGCMLVVVIKMRALIPGLILGAVSAPIILMLAWQGADEMLRTVGRNDVANRYSRGLSFKTRDELWQSRWAEFRSSMLVGVGFASVEGAAATSADEGQVEPGSSVLAILSMTGLLGMSAMLFTTATILVGWGNYWQVIPDRIKLEGAGLSAAWGIHVIAEGYIYGVGSILCLMLWITIGWLADASRPKFMSVCNPPVAL